MPELALIMTFSVHSDEYKLFLRNFRRILLLYSVYPYLTLFFFPSIEIIISPSFNPHSSAGHFIPESVLISPIPTIMTPSIRSFIPKGSPPGISIGVSTVWISTSFTGSSPKSFRHAVSDFGYVCPANDASALSDSASIENLVESSRLFPFET